MKKILSVLSVLLLVFSMSAICLAEESDGALYTASFFDTVSKKSGFEVNNKAAEIKAVTEDGRECVRITPTPTLATAGKDANFNFYSGSLIKIPADVLAQSKKITVSCKYILPEGKESHISEMQLVMLPSGGALSANLTANASAKPEPNKWTTVSFDISDSVKKLCTGSGEAVQMWLRPFGPSPRVIAENLAEYEVMFLESISFYGSADASANGNEEAPKPGIISGTPLRREDMIDAKFTVDYPSKVAKIYDNTGILNKTDEADGIKCLSITPTPTLATADKKMNLDVYSLGIKGSDLDGVKFLGIPYKYVVPEGVTPCATAMQINTLSGHSIKYTSITEPVTNVWTEALFDIRQAAALFAKDGTPLNQMHFYPYGNALGTRMNQNEVMYIGQFRFYDSYPLKSKNFSISFRVDHPGAVGSPIDALVMKPEEKYILPESPWKVEGAAFAGWKSSLDGKLYSAGTSLLSEDTDIVYTAQFETETADEKILLFQNYQRGTVNGLKYCLEVSNVSFENSACVKVVPNKDYENAGSTVTVEGYSYDSARVSLNEYRYAAITYFCKDESPAETKFKMNFMTNGGALLKQYSKEASENLVYGEWAIATFDFSDVDAYLNPEKPNEVIRQIHVKPFGEIKVSEFSGNEEMYVNQIIFFKEKPSLNMYKSYMNGYSTGTFRPAGNMTRAEAVTVIARLAAGSDALVPTDKTSAFSDVTADKWYHKYIAYVESLGYLAGYGESFLPDKAITRAEFVELVYNMGLLSDNGKNGVFTDVPASHPKASVISAAGKAGLVNGYDNGDGTFSFKPDNTITRAEVVTVINNAYGRASKAEDISEDVRYLFSDVDKSHWAYGQICSATLSHLSNGSKWICSMTAPSSFYDLATVDTSVGEAYLTELDGIAEKRAAELRSTESRYSVAGKVYYVSADGNDANDGLSEKTAWKTTAKVENAPLKPGDVVLFRRGDTFRNSFKASAGVTYSAYGEGAKPIINASPESGADASLWTLMDGTENIWIYKNKLFDVGTVVLNGNITAWKIAPSLRNGKFVNSDGSDFVIAEKLEKDLYFFSEVKSTSVTTEVGALYLRCDKGNPGEIFDTVEFNTRTSGIRIGGEGITIDNLCVIHAGVHGVAAGTTKNLTVTNCEIAYIGGSIQHYSETGVPTRLGNGVEIYGSADGYTVDSCYIHHCYDAGITHQYHGKESNHMYNIKYTNNLIEDCAYSIEYFNSDTDPLPTTVYDGRNYLISGNIMRRAGNSFGRLPGNTASTHLKGWTSENKYDKGTFIIEENIFDRAAGYILQTPAKYREWLPVYRNNTYVQNLGGKLGYYDGDLMYYGAEAELIIKYILGDIGAKVYFVS